MPDIILDFSETDDPIISVKGVAGADCKTLTKSLEQKLGAVTSDTPTREMREVASNEQRIQNRR